MTNSAGLDGSAGVGATADSAGSAGAGATGPAAGNAGGSARASQPSSTRESKLAPARDCVSGRQDLPAVPAPRMDGASTVFVLASASPARAATLRSAGIEPLIRVSNADEDAVLARFPNSGSAEGAPAKVVALAEAKAANVVPLISATELLAFASDQDMVRPTEAIVVACDSMLEVDGSLLGKPHSPEVAFDRIRQLSGNDVTLHTGHAIVHLRISDDGKTVEVTDQHAASCATTVHFTQLDDDEIRAYIATGEPLEVAGSFTIDGLGGPFIAGVTGDPHSVVGISLPLVRRIAREVGVFWPSLWNR